MKTTRIALAVSVAAGLALLALNSSGLHAQRMIEPGTSAEVNAPVAPGSADPLDAGVRQVVDAYALIEKNFATEVPADKAFYQGAIPGMLGTLDPHSSFLDPAEYADMQRKQRAHTRRTGTNPL